MLHNTGTADKFYVTLAGKEEAFRIRDLRLQAMSVQEKWGGWAKSALPTVDESPLVKPTKMRAMSSPSDSSDEEQPPLVYQDELSDECSPLGDDDLLPTSVIQSRKKLFHNETGRKTITEFAIVLEDEIIYLSLILADMLDEGENMDAPNPPEA